MDIASKSLVVARRGGVAEWLRERRALPAWCAASRAAVLGAALALHWLRRPSGFFGPRIFADPVGVLGACDGGGCAHLERRVRRRGACARRPRPEAARSGGGVPQRLLRRGVPGRVRVLD